MRAAILPLVLLGPWTGCVAKSARESFELGGPVARAEIELPAGSLTVVGRDAPGVSVEVGSHWRGSRAPEVHADVTDGTLVVRVDCGPLSSCRVDLQLGLPPTADLRLQGAATDLIVRDTTGDLDATITTGAVALADVSGVVDLETTTGDVHATALHAEEVSIETTTGSVDLAFSAVPRRVDVEVTTGRVDLVLPPDGYDVRVSTQTGVSTVEVEQDPASEHDIDVRTTTGSIRVGAG